MLNGEIGYGNTYGNKDYPFFKNFYAGGVNSVRGYEQSSIGPRIYDINGNYRDFAAGGTKRLLANAELYFPIPGMKDNNALRLSTFIDAGSIAGDGIDDSAACFDRAGNAAGCRYSTSLSDIRYSTGLGVSWLSPFGPIKLVLAKPLNKQDGDRTQVLQFQMGQQF